MRLSSKARIIVPLAVVFALLLVFTPRTAKWNYVYHKGEPWAYDTFRAQLDFPIRKTAEQMAEESAKLSSQVTPYFKASADVALKSLYGISQLDFGSCAEIKPFLSSSLAAIYDKGIMSDAALQSLPSDGLLYVQKDKKADKVPSTEVYGLTAARTALLTDVVRAYPSVKVDSVFRALGVYEFITPNLALDEDFTAIVNGRNEKTVSPTLGTMKAGDVLIGKGDIVTEELAQILDSYKFEYESKANNGWSWRSWLGNILICLALTLCLGFALYFCSPGIFSQPSKYLYLLTVFALVGVLEMLAVKYAPEWVLLLPIPVFALYLNAFFKPGTIFPVYLLSLFPMLIHSSDGVALFVMYSVSGAVTIYVFRHFSKGVKQFVAAMITFGVSALIWFGLSLVGVVKMSLTQDLILLFGAALLQVAAYPFIYLMERAFNLVSTSRLEELSESSNDLLRQLEQKAPGTFQHSLQVSAMAQAVARAIGADEYLLKAGALYHDIGKMNNPLCFVENESLVTADAGKYHDGLTPMQSARDIILHVTDGMELMSKHHMPSVLSDFVITHHGVGCVAYFYDKFLKEGGDPALKGDFCYPGRKPQTKEQAVLMICDSIEAASRTLKDYSPDTVSDFVDRMIRDRIFDGQLSEADITVRDIETAGEVLKGYIVQTHHERIKYPKRRLK